MWPHLYLAIYGPTTSSDWQMGQMVLNTLVSETSGVWGSLGGRGSITSNMYSYAPMEYSQRSCCMFIPRRSSSENSWISSGGALPAVYLDTRFISGPSALTT